MKLNLYELKGILVGGLTNSYSRLIDAHFRGKNYA